MRTRDELLADRITAVKEHYEACRKANYFNRTIRNLIDDVGALLIALDSANEAARRLSGVEAELDATNAELERMKTRCELLEMERTK